MNKKSISKSLGWSQEECPLTNTLPTQSQFKIDDMYISSYTQRNINEGILFGCPTDLSYYWEQSIKNAEEHLDSKHIFYIKPLIYQESEGFLLPSILTMAIMDRMKPLEGDAEMASSLRVAWWQNYFGLPEENIINELKLVTWKKPYAWSWEW